MAVTQLDTEITTNAQGPKRVTGDSGSVEQHNIKDVIEADRYANAKAATRKKTGLGIKLLKANQPGAV